MPPPSGVDDVGASKVEGSLLMEMAVPFLLVWIVVMYSSAFAESAMISSFCC